jgi:hypothetical protein
MPCPGAAGRRNPQHFHRVRTGLAPLRTSHPHVCAQAARSSPLAGQAASPAGRAVRAVCRQPAGRAHRDWLGTMRLDRLPHWSRRSALPSPAPGEGRVDVRRCRDHDSCRWNPAESRGRRRCRQCRGAGLKPLPAADGFRSPSNLSADAGILRKLTQSALRITQTHLGPHRGCAAIVLFRIAEAQPTGRPARVHVVYIGDRRRLVSSGRTLAGA